jgi:membrane protease YdiL (CAAX protease family)
MGDLGDGTDLSHYVDVIGLYFAVFVCLYVPYKALRAQRKLAANAASVSRRQIVLSTVLLQILLLTFALLVARSNGIDLWPARAPKLGGVLAGVALLGLCAGTLPLRLKYVRESTSRLLRPSSPKELPLWFALSLLAGVGEEIVYRGVLTDVLHRWSGDATLAIALSALAFGAAHIVQGWKLALFIVFIAAGLQCVVILSGCLYVAMAVHVLYDAIAGVYYSRKL